MEQTTIDITYLGPKQVKLDRTSGITWLGNESNPVPRIHAVRLLRFPTVFERTDGSNVLLTSEEKTETPNTGATPSVIKEAQKRFEEQAEKEESLKALESEEDSEKDNIAAPDSLEAAISLLDKENPEHFGGKGTPKLDAVKLIMNDDTITINDLREAWAKVKGE